jgi:rubrerythrin
MPGSRASQRELVSALREALLLEREALDAYAAAIVRLGDEPLTRDTAMSFLSAHERHFDELDARLRRLGVQVVEASDTPRRLLPPERFSELSGTTAALRLLRVNADELVRRYRELLARPLPEAELAMIRRICNDELRHRAWLAARIQAFARISPEGRRSSIPPSPERVSSIPH